jgi:hypothetical protein
MNRPAPSAIGVPTAELEMRMNPGLRKFAQGRGWGNCPEALPVGQTAKTHRSAISAQLPAL